MHVRRLRAKLGPENEALIGTVRNVGYKFVPARHEGRRPEPAPERPAGSDRQGRTVRTGAAARGVRPRGRAAAPSGNGASR